MKIKVSASKKILSIAKKLYPCAIGKNGFIAESDGREGDGKTPLGRYSVRYGLYRDDRIALPKTKLVFHKIGQDDGWCDSPVDPAYNRPVRLPYPASAENLHRSSHVYDVIIVLGHNDNPPVPGMGSAIFLHVAHEAYEPTEGCVAISEKHMLEIIPLMADNQTVKISA